MCKRRKNPDVAFHALCDKVWREDFLSEAWRLARRNGGQPGVDGESFRNIEGVRRGAVARGTVAGPEGGDLRAASRCGMF